MAFYFSCKSDSGEADCKESELLRSHFPSYSLDGAVRTAWRLKLDWTRWVNLFQVHGFVREIRKYPRKYEKSVKPDSWEDDYLCMAHAKILLPYYFSPNADIQNDSVVYDLFGKIMAGIDNREEWKQEMGLKIDSIDFGDGIEEMLDFNSRVLPSPFKWYSVWRENILKHCRNHLRDTKNL